MVQVLGLRLEVRLLVQNFGLPRVWGLRVKGSGFEGFGFKCLRVEGLFHELRDKGLRLWRFKCLRLQGWGLELGGSVLFCGFALKLQLGAFERHASEFKVLGF